MIDAPVLPLDVGPQVLSESSIGARASVTGFWSAYGFSEGFESTHGSSGLTRVWKFVWLKGIWDRFWLTHFFNEVSCLAHRYGNPEFYLLESNSWIHPGLVYQKLKPWATGQWTYVIAIRRLVAFACLVLDSRRVTNSYYHRFSHKSDFVGIRWADASDGGLLPDVLVLCFEAESSSTNLFTQRFLCHNRGTFIIIVLSHEFWTCAPTRKTVAETIGIVEILVVFDKNDCWTRVPAKNSWDPRARYLSRNIIDQFWGKFICGSCFGWRSAGRILQAQQIQPSSPVAESLRVCVGRPIYCNSAKKPSTSH